VEAPDAAGREIQRLVALFQMTYVGPPMIYYGTESGMWGADDPDDRKPMVWDDLQYQSEVQDPRGRPRDPDRVAFDRELFDYYKSVIRLRRDHAPLRRGDFQVLSADDERGMLAFARTLDSQSLVVVLNRGKANSIRIELPEALRAIYQLIYTTHEEGYRVQQDTTALLLEVPENGGLVLMRE
jgi:glycosidase